MAMNVTVAINGTPIEVLEVVNKGPTSDAEADDPGGERLYEVTLMSRRSPTGTVVHCRDDGPMALAGTAIDLVVEELVLEELGSDG